MSEFIKVRDSGPVRLMRMSRPDKKNALTAPMYAAMASAINGANANRHVRSVLIMGLPDAFCAGNDLKDFLEAAQGGHGLGDSVLHFLYALARAEKPLVAAVQGVAVGVGTTMLMHCDYVVAADNARFMTPFTQLGLVPEAGSSLIAPRLMGHRRAFALLVMGETLDAQQARECGLVNDVVAAAQTDDVAMKAAEAIAALPPEALREARRLVRGNPDEIVARIDEEAHIYRERLNAPEAGDAFEKFFAKKK